MMAARRVQTPLAVRQILSVKVRSGSSAVEFTTKLEARPGWAETMSSRRIRGTTRIRMVLKTLLNMARSP
jgi:hypothetical protein